MEHQVGRPKWHMRRTLLGLTAAVSVAFLAASTAFAGTNGQHINGKNGHSQNLLCLSGYNQNGYYQSGICTWLDNSAAGAENHLAPSYWWKTYNSTNVILDSYYNYPNPPIYMGSSSCYVAEYWTGGDWWTCQAY